jgi:hypothetical protein
MILSSSRKLTSAQLLKCFPIYYEALIFITVFTKASLVVLGGVMGIVLAMDPRNAGSNPAEDGFLRAIKIRSTTSFGGEVRPSPHVVRFYGMLQNHTGMKRDTCVLNSRTCLAKFLPASLL